MKFSTLPIAGLVLAALSAAPQLSLFPPHLNPFAIPSAQAADESLHDNRMLSLEEILGIESADTDESIESTESNNHSRVNPSTGRHESTDSSRDGISTWGDNYEWNDHGGLDTSIKKCNQFIGADGKIGPYGKIVKDYIEQDRRDNHGHSAFLDSDLKGFQPNDRPRICPNWSYFNTRTKEKFWIWTIGAMAAIESGCRAEIKNKCLVPCSGLLQMENSPKRRSWRGDHCNVSEARIGHAGPNIRCGMDIIEELLQATNQYHTNGAFVTRGSYWEELRKPGGGNIGRFMRAFEPCKYPSFIPVHRSKSSHRKKKAAR